MTLSQKAVEAAANTLRKQRNNSFENQAQAALAAALAVDGLCLAPQVATDKKICAALDDYDERTRRHHSQSYSHTWESMLAAASTGDSPRHREG